MKMQQKQAKENLHKKGRKSKKNSQMRDSQGSRGRGILFFFNSSLPLPAASRALLVHEVEPKNMGIWLRGVNKT